MFGITNNPEKLLETVSGDLDEIETLLHQDKSLLEDALEREKAAIDDITQAKETFQDDVIDPDNLDETTLTFLRERLKHCKESLEQVESDQQDIIDTNTAENVDVKEGLSTLETLLTSFDSAKNE